MPGIVGLISKMPRQQAEPQLRRMVARLCHESFYVAGTWVDESLGVYVGWIARENSFSDRMPLYNQRKDTVLVFSGEEFSQRGVVSREVDANGASYLLNGCEEDPCFPAGLNGRFHGLLADRTDRSAMLFVDRYAMHRLYYHENKVAFYFAAEAKAILAVRPQLRGMDARGLGELVPCRCELQNRPICEGI